MPRSSTAALTAEDVWKEIEKATFAVLSHVTPTGHPRSSGVIYGVAGRAVVVVAAFSWKSRHIADGGEVAITVPVRRGGLLSLVAPIPPATISFHACVARHAPGELPRASLPPKLVKGLPKDRRDNVTVLHLHPVGEFLTYGIGVPLMAMRDPAKALARVPVTDPDRRRSPAGP